MARKERPRLPQGFHITPPCRTVTPTGACRKTTKSIDLDLKIMYLVLQNYEWNVTVCYRMMNGRLNVD